MIRMIARKIIFALGFVSLTAHAAPNWVRYQDYKINLEVPKGWRIERDLYGMPITVLGPERNGERAILNVQHTPIENFSFDQKMIENTQEQYFIGRKEWLSESEETEFLEKIPYQKISNQKFDGFQLGFKYRMREQEFEERSIQFVCRDRLYLIKTLYSKQEPDSDRQTLANIVQNLNCAAVTKADGPYQASPLQDLAKKIEAQAPQNRWPNQEQIRKASPESKAIMLEAAVEFYKSFEEAAGESLYSQTNEKVLRLKAMMKMLSAGLGDTAFAAGNYDCFFGGWPSRYVNRNGRMTCASPEETNPDYKKSASKCSASQLACNPTLFGDNVCISTTRAAERANATQRCEAQFKSSGKSYDDVVKSPSFNQALFEQTIESAEAVCTEADYTNGNYGLCSVLKTKLNLSIDNGSRTSDDEDQNFINHLDSIKPSNYDQAVDSTFANYAEFEKRCFDDQKNFKPDSDANMDAGARDSCIQDLNRLTDDLNKLEKMHKQVEKEVDQASAPEKQALRNKDCPDCGVNGANKATQTETDPTGNPNCTAAENKAVAAGKCTGKTYAAAAANIVLAVVPALWRNVTLIANIGLDSLKYVGNKLQQGWDYFFASKKVENATANKAHQASKTTNSFISQFLKDPLGTSANLGRAILDGIIEFAKTDIFCEKWSGVPHFSKCAIPGSDWECMSCDTRVRGIGSLAGYALAEIIPAFITGGLVGSGSKIAEFMRLPKMAGKFAKLGAEAASKFPRMAKAAKATKYYAKTALEFAKTNRISRAAQTTFRALTRTKAMLRVFKSKIYKNYPEMMASMNKLRSKYWLARKGVQLAKASAKGTALLVTSPIRVPYQVTKWTVTKNPLLRAQRSMYQTGLRFQERLLNSTLVGTKAAIQGRRLGVGSSYLKYGAGLVQNMSEASNIQGQQADYTNTLKPLTDKIVQGKSLNAAETEKFAKLNGISVDSAKVQLVDEKLILLAQGNTVKLTDDEMQRYAASKAAQTQISKELALANLKLTVLESKYPAKLTDAEIKLIVEADTKDGTDPVAYEQQLRKTLEIYQKAAMPVN